MSRIRVIKYGTSREIMPGYWEKISMTAELLPGEDAEAETFLLKEKIEKLQKRFNSNPPPVSISEALGITQVDSRSEKMGAMFITISECKTLRNLEMFEAEVNRLHEQSLYEAYNNKKKELQ